ncbi:hypothetical protein [Campylobacter vulpis]|uniref:hypothetical protein n=2 Tax=Campylobacter vulpis TaxID=1655500 RepID=UPI002079F13B|nr:hypothetical protein [Campylobacter vulpis]
MYKSKIDMFIFNVQDEEFGTIFEIIWSNYPIIFALFALVLAVGVCVLINHKIFKDELKASKAKCFYCDWNLCFSIKRTLSSNFDE